MSTNHVVDDQPLHSNRTSHIGDDPNPASSVTVSLRTLDMTQLRAQMLSEAVRTHGGNVHNAEMVRDTAQTYLDFVLGETPAK